MKPVELKWVILTISRAIKVNPQINQVLLHKTHYMKIRRAFREKINENRAPVEALLSLGGNGVSIIQGSKIPLNTIVFLKSDTHYQQVVDLEEAKAIAQGEKVEV